MSRTLEQVFEKWPRLSRTQRRQVYLYFWYRIAKRVRPAPIFVSGIIGSMILLFFQTEAVAILRTGELALLFLIGLTISTK